MTLEADRLGLLTATCDAPRRPAQGRADDQQNTAFEETRQQLWLTIPFDMEKMAWWCGGELISPELVPFLRTMHIRANSPADDHYAQQLLQAASIALQTQHSDVVRFASSLAELAWPTRWIAWSAISPRLQAILQ